MAQSLANHYDSLNVRRDAPLDVIKTSYRKLSQKNHPDRNPDPAALETMILINQAWDVLSDPERRASHDRAIEEFEDRSAMRPPGSVPRHPAANANANFSAYGARNTGSARAAGAPGNLAVYISLAVAMLLLLLSVTGLPFAWPGDEEGDQISNAPQTIEDQLIALQPRSDRVDHGYLMSVAQDKAPGIAVVEIDNRAGKADAEVRLFRNKRAARSMFVHQGKKFVVEDVAPGSYVIKYKVIVDGKVMAYQVRQPFLSHKENFKKLKLTLFDTTADRILAEQF